MSPRIRLTLAVAVIVALAATLVDVGVYITFANQLNGDVENRLNSAASLVLKTDQTVGAAFLTTGLASLTGDDQLLALSYDTTGNQAPLTADTRASNINFPRSAWVGAANGTSSFYTVSGDGGDYRFEAFPAPPHFVVANHSLVAVALGQSLSSTQSTLRQLLILLVIASVTGTVLAALAAWFSSGQLMGAAGGYRVPSGIALRSGGPQQEAEIELLTRLADHIRERMRHLTSTLATLSDTSRRHGDGGDGYAAQSTRAGVGPTPEMPASFEMMRAARSDADNISRATECVSALARIETVGTRRIKFAWMPLLEATLREAHRICAPRALVIDMTPPLGSCVGDPDALHQLLRLLFFSAVDRSPDTATISFSAGWRDNVVVISISDDGPGLPRARLSRLFDVRGPSADSAQDAGLIVAGAIVRAHGGSIQAEPIEPHGVRIRALVPTAAEGAMRAVVVGDQRNA